jgi:hypothetical protein
MKIITEEYLVTGLNVQIAVSDSYYIDIRVFHMYRP